MRALEQGSTVTAESILVVDDAPVFLRLMQAMVSVQVPGAEITAVSSPADALEALQRQRFDLIVSDFHMPEMNGDELVAQIRRQPATAGVPVLVLTTEERAEPRDVVLSYQHTRWVHKGPDGSAFTAAIRELLHEGRG